jgi:hypothetical protein
LEDIMTARIFTVRPLDRDSNKRHFSKIDSALAFAAREARGSWSGTEWTVTVPADESVRIVVDVTNHFEVRVNGDRVGTGYLSSKGKTHATEGAWDVFDRVSEARS